MIISEEKLVPVLPKPAKRQPKIPRIVWSISIGLSLGITVAIFVNEKFYAKSSSTEIQRQRLAFQKWRENENRTLSMHKHKEYLATLNVKATWGKRCNKLIFMSSKEDPTLPAIDLNITEDYDSIWGKTRKAFEYSFKNHFNDADWFLKADDDTFVIMENLRFLLSPYNPSDPLYFGCKFRPYVEHGYMSGGAGDAGYMSGGAGYVLSKEALRRLVVEALPDDKLCRSDEHGAEDVEMGKCLQNVKVVGGDTRDHEGSHRFMPFTPESHVMPGRIDWTFWYWKNLWYPAEQGMNCCSDSAISFHYMAPSQMYSMEYMLYHLRPFGMTSRPHKVEDFRVMQNLELKKEFKKIEVKKE